MVFLFLAYLHNGLQVDHSLSFIPVFPIPLITPMTLETAHPLCLESVSLKCTRKDAMIAAIEALVQ